jgi:hypothetical protein
MHASKQKKLIIFPELSLKQGHIYHFYYDVQLRGTGRDRQRDTARVHACVYNINLKSTNLEWNFHNNNRVNKVNKLLKCEAKKYMNRKQHNILKTQHPQRSLYIKTLKFLNCYSYTLFPLFMKINLQIHAQNMDNTSA